MGRTVADMPQEQMSRWSLAHTGNRALWSVVAGWLTWIVSHNLVAGLLVALVLFLLLTGLVTFRR